MIDAVVIEDEFHSREAMKNLIKAYCPGARVLAAADDVESGFQAILKHKPHLVLLDIQLKTGTGFDLLEKIGVPDFEIIFTTAYENFAVKAFKFSAIDYLLKPIDPRELAAAVEKANKKIDSEAQRRKFESLWSYLKASDGAGKNQTITLSTSEGYEFVPVDQIVYCEASGAYTAFHLKGGKKLLVSKNLKEYELILSRFHFFRSHQSFLINLSQVERMVKAEGGYIVMKNGRSVNISSKKKEEFIRLMGGKS